jgi:hypothetical protein
MDLLVLKERRSSFLKKSSKKLFGPGARASTQKFSFFVTAQFLPPPLWGRAGVGAVPRRQTNREAGKQKTLVISASVCQERPKPNSQKFFGSFFQKSTAFLP